MARGMMLANSPVGTKEMSRRGYRWIVVIALFVGVMLRPPGASGADDKKHGKGACPDKWHLKDEEKPYKGGKVFMCIPDKPTTKVTCHPDTEYFEEDGAFGCEVPAEIEDDEEGAEEE